MSEDKSKTKLGAIFNLEFYKKQKNWKLERAGSSEKHVAQTANLNRTYSVEENSEPLNHASKETDVGDKRPNYGNLPEEMPRKSASYRLQQLVRLSRIQQEKDAKEAATAEAEPYGCAHFDCAAEVAESGNEYYEDVPENVPEDVAKDVPEDVPDSGQTTPEGQVTQEIWNAVGCCEASDQSTEPDRAMDELFPELAEGCPAGPGPAGDESTSAAPQGLDDAEREREQAREQEREQEREQAREQAREQEREQEQAREQAREQEQARAHEADAPRDNESAFMRGAGVAPHSSQPDLSVPEDGGLAAPRPVRYRVRVADMPLAGWVQLMRVISVRLGQRSRELSDSQLLDVTRANNFLALDLEREYTRRLLLLHVREEQGDRDSEAKRRAGV